MHAGQRTARWWPTARARSSSSTPARPTAPSRSPRSFDAKVFIEEWKGYTAQKNSAIEKAEGDWILSLDADEEIGPGLAGEVYAAMHGRLGVDSTSEEDSLEVVEKVMAIEEAQASGETGSIAGFWIPRKNFFLGRWIKHGGFWPDPKLRLFCKGAAKFEERLVHEDAKIEGVSKRLNYALLHHSYPTLADYIDHMNRYSSLGAEMAIAKGRRGFSVFNIVLRPLATFIYNYFFRLGFLDGREGLLLHLYHAVYVSWKYAKAWELARSKESM